jgi:hypothetical protein
LYDFTANEITIWLEAKFPIVADLSLQ